MELKFSLSHQLCDSGDLFQKYMYNKVIKIIFVAFVAITFVVVNTSYAFADESNYGGTEIKNKSFRIEKEVRMVGDNSWKDKVTDVEENEVVEFRIRVENVGEVEVDDMKMEDFLPDEMYRVGGDGLTEYWDNFAPGDVETFKIKAQVESDEYDREDFEKCVVNKAEITYDGDFEGSDTATVCYGNVEVTELPKTGAGSTFAIAGTALVVVGTLIRKKRK